LGDILVKDDFVIVCVSNGIVTPDKEFFSRIFGDC
jgi:hypothetical protein